MVRVGRAFTAMSGKRQRDAGPSASSGDPHRASFSAASKSKGGSGVFKATAGGKKPGAVRVAAVTTKEVRHNPFETVKQRSKFAVLGRKLKGTEREAGQARSRAIQKRKESLLVELKQSEKRNQFIDHRFGEGDTTLSTDDKFLMRFQKERSRKPKYSLEVWGDESAVVCAVDLSAHVTWGVVRACVRRGTCDDYHTCLCAIVFVLA